MARRLLAMAEARTHQQAEEEAETVTPVFRRMVKRMFLSGPMQSANRFIDRARQERALRRWERGGHSLPLPHRVKQRILKEYAAEFSLDTLVETGTYLGAMIEATRDTFGRIYSVELDPDLCGYARRRFAACDHIALIHGDSAEILPGILADLHQACLFWLDAHHSGALTARGGLESPVLLELRSILEHPVDGHVVLIDDAHAFAGQEGYPTIAELQAMVAMRHPDWVCEVTDDIIRIHKGRDATG